MNPAAAEIKISGSVQGVGYRYFCYQQATHLQLTGWVKNNRDRTVSVLVEGEKSVIEEFILQLKEGPPASVVAEVAVNWLSCFNSINRFEIKH